VVTGSNIIAWNYQHRRFSSKSGSSMAAPVVSGAVARLIKNNPDITPKEVKIWMKSCCKKINVPSEKQGWGVLDIRKFVTG
uniref:S8 family serine peptidase n=1 Tax=Lachnospira sp. TaxID=2049031 RepID=UPI003FED9E84